MLKAEQIQDAVQDVSIQTVDDLVTKLSAAKQRIQTARLNRQIGWVKGIRGSIVSASISHVRVGDICEIKDSETTRLAEVVGFEDDVALLGPFSSIQGIQKRALIMPVGHDIMVPTGEGLLGRVIGPLGAPIDNQGALQGVEHSSVRGTSVGAMERPLISEPLETGIKAIDAALLLGGGQRIGVFGPAGVGKSNLLSALARGTNADVIVIGLIGERAREVREFLDRQLPAEDRKRIVCVVSTSERPPMERLYAVHTANRVAEGFRDAGKSVLLLVDSLTRVARALRELGLSAGEPPTRRGFPASVYTALPGIIERAGRTDVGSITAIYTVLTEGEMQDDPIAEEVRSLTDGHIILSRELSERGQYPAIDVLSSISRLMADLATPEHTEAAKTMRRLLSRYAEVEMLIQIGEYSPGADRELDQAVANYDEFQRFLRQTPQEAFKLSETLDHLDAIIQ